NEKPDANQRQDRQAQRLIEDRAKLRSEESGGGGTRGFQDHGVSYAQEEIGGGLPRGKVAPCEGSVRKTLQLKLQQLNPSDNSKPGNNRLRDLPEYQMSEYDVLCIGNAIVDVIARCDEAFLVENGIVKGAMNLVDADRATLLYDRMGQAVEMSGGSAGNTAAALAGLGAKTAYFGKVSQDPLGDIYRHDIRAQGVAFDTAALEGFPPTARCMIFVTPDGERSMNTYLGASIELGPEDVEEEKAKAAKVTYFEGYLWDPPRAKEAIRLTADMAHAAGREVSMTLSDPFCVDRFRDEFLELMRSGTVDIVFANEHEVKSLYQTASLDTALAA